MFSLKRKLIIDVFYSFTNLTLIKNLGMILAKLLISKYLLGNAQQSPVMSKCLWLGLVQV